MSHVLFIFLILIKCLQEYSVQLTFREQWLDERLKFDDFKGILFVKHFMIIASNHILVGLHQLLFLFRKALELQIFKIYHE